MVVLTTSGGDVAMRVHHGDADRIIDIIMRLQRGEVVAPVAPAPPTGPGFLGQVQAAANELADGVRQAANDQPTEPAVSTDDVITQLKNSANSVTQEFCPKRNSRPRKRICSPVCDIADLAEAGVA